MLNEKKGGKGINREREMQKRGTKSVGISKVQRMSSGIQKRNKNWKNFILGEEGKIQNYEKDYAHKGEKGIKV